MTALRNLSDVRNFFQRSRAPTFYVCATPSELLGIDEWVNGFRYVNYIDCFDGGHRNVLVPREAPHAEFTGIEDINNYLLEHKEVVEVVARARRAAPAGRAPQAVFLMFDERTEAICQALGLEIAFPPAKLRREVDDKVSTTRIGNRAGVASVPNVLGKVDSFSALRKLAASAALGTDLVVQTSFGDSGHTTFFISTEGDYKKYAAEIECGAEVKVMKRIHCRSYAQEACATRHGTLVGPLMTELVGFAELTPYRGGWCGNEVFPGVCNAEVRERARTSTLAVGDELRKMGYRGYFEIDYLIDLDTGAVYLGELNPRITGASSLTNLASFGWGDAPLFLFHLLEFAGVDFELDVEALNARFADPDNLDAWSQLVIKYTGTGVDHITAAPKSGLWRLTAEATGIEYVGPATHRRAVQGEEEAFFLRTSGVGDYRYEGADLGILLARGRMMTDDHQLTPRARQWIDGIRGEYAVAPLAPKERPRRVQF